MTGAPHQASIHEPCRVALLTPLGRAAVAALSVEGSRAMPIVSQRFRPAGGKRLEQFPEGRVVFGRWSDGPEPGEDLVVCHRAATVAEIHCHGGQAAATAILSSLKRAGCLVVDAPTWAACREADRLSAEARVALCEAQTLRASAILLDQYRGTLRVWLERTRDLLLNSDRAAVRRLVQLERWAEAGLHLTKPWRVVLAGRANVGKSSLINAILGYRRAIEHPQPGATRDVVTAQTAMDGWPVELADTAGLRRSVDPIESLAVSRALRQIASADLAVLVFDVTQPWCDEDRKLLESTRSALAVHNKCDLLVEPFRGRPGLLISAKTGQGVGELVARIAQRLVPSPPPAQAAVPFMPHHVEALRSALAAARRSDFAAAISQIDRIV